ncbi:MAG: lysine--tRNA ligase [Helicobacteraceae bacterium]
MKFFDNEYIQTRIEKAGALRDLGLNPYSNECAKNASVAEFIEKFSHLKDPEAKDETANLTLAGRIKFLRLMGKANFAKVEDETGAIQIYFSKDSIGEETFGKLKKNVEVGDIIEVQGYPFVTKTSELSVYVKRLKLLTKSIAPLPEKFHGLVDKELRYRQRHLDLIMNDDVRKTFVLRSKIISLVRKFFEAKGFLEVETPMLHPIAGGANAKPFVTFHNTLGVERFLRIAPELYLKRLIVGGFEAVFELNRNFRNEGMDLTHNPEFTAIEFYWAYKTYEDLISLTQEFFAYLIQNLGLRAQIAFGSCVVDFSRFERYTYDEALVKIAGFTQDELSSKETLARAAGAKDLKIENISKLSLGHLKAAIFDACVEDKLINPTFITDFPVEISPLARRSDKNKDIVERFELFIAGKELANGFSELNDPLDQYERFKAQVEAKKSGDDEAHQMDEDYVRALSYGMPPTAGEGIGIDRLVMLLTQNESIKDVIFFPAMKPEKDESK